MRFGRESVFARLARDQFGGATAESGARARLPSRSAQDARAASRGAEGRSAGARARRDTSEDGRFGEVEGGAAALVTGNFEQRGAIAATLLHGEEQDLPAVVTSIVGEGASAGGNAGC